jgi:hypothetical protein
VGELPTGTVTFLFTDIEGSTWLLRELAEAADPIDDSAAEAERYEVLEPEHPNVRTAVEIAIARDDHTFVLVLTRGLWSFWLARGHMKEGHTWSEWGLAGEDVPAEIRANALVGAGELARFDRAIALKHEILSSHAPGSRVVDGRGNPRGSRRHRAHPGKPRTCTSSIAPRALSRLRRLRSARLGCAELPQRCANDGGLRSGATAASSTICRKRRAQRARR